MDLIEIVGVCKTNSRINGFSEHNEEKKKQFPIVYSPATMAMIYWKWQSK